MATTGLIKRQAALDPAQCSDRGDRTCSRCVYVPPVRTSLPALGQKIVPPSTGRRGPWRADREPLFTVPARRSAPFENTSKALIGILPGFGHPGACTPLAFGCRPLSGRYSWIVLSPRSASSATLALKSGVNRRRVVIFVFLHQMVEYTLNNCPIFWDHLRPWCSLYNQGC